MSGTINLTGFFVASGSYALNAGAKQSEGVSYGGRTFKLLSVNSLKSKIKNMLSRNTTQYEPPTTENFTRPSAQERFVIKATEPFRSDGERLAHVRKQFEIDTTSQIPCRVYKGQASREVMITAYTFTVHELRSAFAALECKTPKSYLRAVGEVAQNYGLSGEMKDDIFIPNAQGLSTGANRLKTDFNGMNFEHANGEYLHLTAVLMSSEIVGKATGQDEKVSAFSEDLREVARRFELDMGNVKR